MIVDNDVNKSHVLGALESGRFSIDMGSDLVQTLAGEMYVDSISSVVRELISNVVDIHKQIGQRKSYEITVGDNLVIRDFGPGLSKEDFVSYATFGSSTKDNCNDAIGGFGLGAKTPIAYLTNGSWNVISRNGGIKSTYELGSKDGKAYYVLLNEEQSSEDSGLEIIIPINSADIGRFMDAVKHTTYWLDMPVKVNGEVIPTCSSFEREIFPCVTLSRKLPKGSVWVNMGGVLYRVDESFGSWFIGNGHNLDYILLYGFGAVFEFPVGTFELIRSRESVVFNSDSRKNLSDMINGFNKNFLGRVDDGEKNNSSDKDNLLYFANLDVDCAFDTYISKVLMKDIKKQVQTDMPKNNDAYRTFGRYHNSDLLPDAIIVIESGVTVQSAVEDVLAKNNYKNPIVIRANSGFNIDDISNEIFNKDSIFHNLKRTVVRAELSVNNNIDNIKGLIITAGNQLEVRLKDINPKEYLLITKKEYESRKVFFDKDVIEIEKFAGLKGYLQVSDGIYLRVAGAWGGVGSVKNYKTYLIDCYEKIVNDNLEVIKESCLAYRSDIFFNIISRGNQGLKEVIIANLDDIQIYDRVAANERMEAATGFDLSDFYTFDKLLDIEHDRKVSAGRFYNERIALDDKLSTKCQYINDLQQDINKKDYPIIAEYLKNGLVIQSYLLIFTGVFSIIILY